MTEEEKNEAASVAGYALQTLCTLSAPFTPFLAEEIYQGLKDKMGLKEESVHLANWPSFAKASERTATKKILNDMTGVRSIVAEALKQRSGAGIKVRQPLASLTITHKRLQKDLLELIKEEVNVKQVVFGGGLALDTVITSELKEEGMMREIIRNIQEMRKDLGLHPKNRIRAHFSGTKEIDAILERWKKFVMDEAGAVEVLVGGKKTYTAERDLKIDDAQLWAGIDKV